MVFDSVSKPAIVPIQDHYIAIDDVTVEPDSCGKFPMSLQTAQLRSTISWLDGIYTMIQIERPPPQISAFSDNLLIS